MMRRTSRRKHLITRQLLQGRIDNMTTVKLDTPAQVSIARAIRQNRADLLKRAEALQEEFQASLQALAVEAQASMNKLWRELLIQAAQDPEGFSDWTLDSTYLEDHALVFLTRTEKPAEDHLQDLLKSLIASTDETTQTKH